MNLTLKTLQFRLYNRQSVLLLSSSPCCCGAAVLPGRPCCCGAAGCVVMEQQSQCLWPFLGSSSLLRPAGLAQEIPATKGHAIRLSTIQFILMHRFLGDLSLWSTLKCSSLAGQWGCSTNSLRCRWAWWHGKGCVSILSLASHVNKLTSAFFPPPLDCSHTKLL